MQMSILPKGCSHLANDLFGEYAFGGLSANQVQKLTRMAQFDGDKHPHSNKLASLGTIGLVIWQLQSHPPDFAKQSQATSGHTYKAW